MVLPLPEGEGRGEGEKHSPAATQVSLADNTPGFAEALALARSSKSHPGPPVFPAANAHSRSEALSRRVLRAMHLVRCPAAVLREIHGGCHQARYAPSLERKKNRGPAARTHVVGEICRQRTDG